MNITVTSVNDVPVAVADTATTAEDTAVAITAASLLSNDTGLGDGPVTVTSVQAPVNGTVSLAAGVITFTPNANYNGPASFTYTITDSNGDTSTATVNITVTSVNDVPVAVADTVTVTEDIPFTSVVQLDANDTDLDGNALTVVPGTFTTSAGGSIVIAADGSYVYTPPLNFNGTDTVNYTVTDGSLTDIGQLTLNVSPANDPPVNTVPGAQSAVENAPFAIPGLSVTDLDGNLATTQLSVNNGTVTIGNLNGATILAGTNGTSTLTLSGTETQINAALATLSYQGNLNFSGPDVLTVLSTDSAGTALTDTDTVSITVGAQPIFSINDVTVNEGAGTITFTVTKSGATALTTTVNYAVAPNSAVTPGDYAAGTSALTGTLSFAPGVTTQTIVLNIADDAVFELAETFNVNLSAPTNAAIADSLGVGTITDNDAAPSFAINDVSVSESAGTITFTVTKTAATDVASSVTYTAADGSATAPGDYTAGTNPLSGVLNFAAGVTSQTIVLNITNDAVAELTETFNVDLSAAVNATISDSLGVATIADDEGAPTFSINDVTVNENAGTITFTVTKSGTTALTTTVDYAVAPNSAVTPGDYAAGTSALTGTLSFASGVTTRTIVLNITNDAVFELAESFNVNLSAPINATIADSLGVGTITDNDAAPNTPPVATADVFATNEDAGLTLSPVALLGNDIDANGDPLVLLSVQSATNGTVALIGGNIVFTPAPNYSGPASFAYTISDNNGGTSTATVSVNVLPVNDSPVANGDSAGSTAEDTPVSVSASSLLGNDSDPDGDLLTVASVQSGVGGTVSLAGGVITFTPNQNFNGPASFTYTVSDGNGGFATATVTVNVTAVNDAPVASDDSVSTNEDQPLTLTSATLLGNDVDVDGDSLTIVSVQSPANGTVSLVNGLMVFTPVANYNGPASLVYTVTDSQGSTSTATVNIAVISVNDAPLSVDDLAPDTFEDVPLAISAADLLSNDSDVDFDKLLIASVQNPTNGTVQIVGGNIVFIPAPGYDGPASFTYTVVDGKGGTSTARVELKILGVNNPAFHNSNFSSTDDQRPNVPEFTTVADPALHVLFSVTEVRASVELRGDRGLFQTDGATFAELTSGLRADLTFAEGNQFGSRGLGGTRNNSTARDTNAVFVRQAVTYQSLGLENGLYVHDAVYASQLESSARSIRIASFNSAVPGVPNLLDGFSLGSPVSLTGAQQTGEVTNAQNMPIPDILNGLIDQAADCVPCSSSPASETSAVATFPIHPRISRGADSFAAQLQRNAEAFKTRSTPVANRVAGISQVRV